MKKRLFVLCMIALVAFSFIGCDDKTSEPVPASDKEVETAGYIIYAVNSAVMPGADGDLKDGVTTDGKGEFTFDNFKFGDSKLNGSATVKESKTELSVTYDVKLDNDTATGSLVMTIGTDGIKFPPNITMTLNGKEIIIDTTK